MPIWNLRHTMLVTIYDNCEYCDILMFLLEMEYPTISYWVISESLFYLYEAVANANLRRDSVLNSFIYTCILFGNILHFYLFNTTVSVTKVIFWSMTGKYHFCFPVKYKCCKFCLNFNPFILHHNADHAVYCDTCQGRKIHIKHLFYSPVMDFNYCDIWMSCCNRWL